MINALLIKHTNLGFYIFALDRPVRILGIDNVSKIYVIQNSSDTLVIKFVDDSGIHHRGGDFITHDSRISLKSRMRLALLQYRINIINYQDI